LALRCGLSRATFHRKFSQPTARLDPLGSDVFIRYSTLLTQALDTFFGDSAATKNWLNAPRSALGGAIPLEYAISSAGYDAVRTLLGQIDRGVYV
jgi:putative toxin-antitoxin system antitoxin component (TIGR02293 family)